MHCLIEVADNGAPVKFARMGNDARGFTVTSNACLIARAKAHLADGASWHGIRESAHRTQLAPLSLHDVLQVTVLPFMHALQTSTHWLSFRASKS